MGDAQQVSGTRVGGGNRWAVDTGKFPPSVQIRHFSDDEWEAFIEACCLLTGNYVKVKRLGGSGDGGRDIEARLVENLEADKWDLYQAKHYKNPISRGQLFKELGKVFENIRAGTYPRPRYYYLCAPLNASTDLHDWLAKPQDLKKEFISDLKEGKSGLKKPPKGKAAALFEVIEHFDFANIKEYLSRDLLNLYATDTDAYHKLFHIIPERGADPTAPESPAREEQVYVQELLGVYGEDAQSELTLAEVQASEQYGEHFEGCRSEFYCAEGLKRFSRDLMPGEFEELLSMVHKGVRTVVSSPKHNTGLERLEAATARATTLSVTDSPLHSRLRGGDLAGTCHHLVNEEKLKWLK